MSQAEQRWNAARELILGRQDGPPLVRASEGAPAPASFAQEGLWLLDRLDPGGGAYNLAVACRLRGPLDLGALERSLAELVGRHEILRTTLAMVDGRLVQRVAPEGGQVLRMADVAADELPAWTAERAAQSFDLERGPLFRAELARIAEHDHCLLLANHHVTLDAWSFELMMRDLCARYGAHLRGEPPGLPSLSLHYGDFASWQRQRMAGPSRDRLLAYWRATLPNEAPTLALPVDRPRRPGPNGRGESQSRVYDKRLTDALKSLARGEGVTLYTVLLAAWQTLLHRYSGDEEVLVGSPVAVRHRAELVPMLGLFINTLPMCTRLGDGPSFRVLLSRAHATVTGALAHQELPFELLVSGLGAHGHAGSPWFRVMFAFQNVPRSGWQWPGLACTAWNVEPPRAKLDLTLTMQETEHGLTALLCYDADLFAPSTVDRLMDCFANLLEAVVSDPDVRIDRLALLSSAERGRLLTAGQGPVIGAAVDRSIHRLFEAQVRRTPDAIALIASDGASMSYAELNRRANRLARRLRKQGLVTGGLVGLALDRSTSLIVAELAVLKAGGAYVPVPVAPRARLERLLRPVAVVVTETGWRERLPVLAVPHILVDQDGPPDETDDDLEASGSPDALAYVMFTSGSTGEPRGVRVRHSGVIRLVADATYASLTSAEVFLQLAPVAFDASTFEIWGALLNGATLVLAPAHPLSVAEMGALVNLNGITTLWLTSGLFELLVDEGLEGLGGLRQLLTGGDVMSVRHARRFRARWPECRLLNCYGPTENTTFTTTHQVGEVEDDVPIGRPIADTTVYLLDDLLEPVPWGVVGQAYVGGAGVAAGYLDDAEATRERFIESPFAAGDILYRTGDRMRRRVDGAFEFRGRVDDQVKIRGFRVEPVEVERALARCAGVGRVLVRAESDGGAGRRLCAYVVPEQAEVDLPAKLRSALRASLPAYMVPSAITLVASLPITDNGKRAQPSTPPAPPAVVTFRPPRDPWESMVADVFAKVLGKTAVDIHESFFDIGGDSLGAIHVVAHLERETGRQVPLASFFQKSSIAALACELRAGVAPAIVDDAVMVLKEGQGSRPLFLVPGGRGGKPELMICARLVSRLDAAETVIGLLVPAIGKPVEALAREHIATMKRLQPSGPYRLGGECIGGVIAYEIAQQLHARGDVVELLLLLDCWCPTGAGRLSGGALAQRLAPRRLLDKSRELLRAGVAFFAEIPRRAPDAVPWPVELWQRVTVPSEAKRHIAICMRYRPLAYAGHVTILASAESLQQGLAEPWQSLAKSSVIHRAPGGHESYSRRYVQQSAEALRICLDADKQSRGEHGLTD